MDNFSTQSTLPEGCVQERSDSCTHGAFWEAISGWRMKYLPDELRSLVIRNDTVDSKEYGQSNAEALRGQLLPASSLTIVCHDNPDPDCLAAAIALELIAKESGVTTVNIVYEGIISHHQNRAFVDLLEIDIKPYSEDTLHMNDLIAFVDHSIPGAHNPVPEDTDIDIVIDHHPSVGSIPATFVDVREDYGAAATILTEYIRELEIEPPTRVASGLLFALHRERLDFIRQPTVHEYTAAAYLHPFVDLEILRELYDVSFTPGTVDAVKAAIDNRVIRGSCLVSCVGRTENHHALAQAADYLLNIEGVDTVLVCGLVRDKVQLSARTRESTIDLGKQLHEAFEPVGNAGGHLDMAGGQIPITVYNNDIDRETDLVSTIFNDVTHRFFTVMQDSEN